MRSVPYSFDTPAPISATLSVPNGDLVCEASETATTTVVVTGRGGERVTPEDVTVTYSDGHLEVTVPKIQGWFNLLASGQGPNVKVTLPQDSRIIAEGSYGDVRLDGGYAAITVKTSMGDVTVGDSADTDIKTSQGDVRAGRLTGHTVLTTANGDIRVTAIDGTAVCKTSNGSVRIDAASGDVRATTANGDLRVDDFAGTLGGTTAAGDVRVNNARAGSIAASTRFGDLTFGIPSGTATWVDVSSAAGKVRNHLDAGDDPGAGAPRLQIRAQTSFGDISLRRSRDERR
jgi:DUF4097 and DUF4098 domain-containing protein YvlB